MSETNDRETNLSIVTLRVDFLKTEYNFDSTEQPKYFAPYVKKKRQIEKHFGSKF